MKDFWNKYRKIIIIAAATLAVTAGAVILAVSGKKKDETSETKVPEETVLENITEASEAETEGETETVGKPYSNPLTGEPSDVNYSDVRPVAVMLNTIKQALPQSGNSGADIFIEIPEEGGVTRICGLYQDITGVGTIGSVRSTREYFLSFAKSFDAILAHAGGDSWVLDEIADSGYTTMDCLTNAGGAFWRDEERLKKASREHSLVTSSDNIRSWIDTSGIQKGHTGEDNTHFDFTDELSGRMIESAESVRVKFSGYKSTTFKYNSDSRKYDVYFWDNDEPYIDSGNGKQIDVTNVIVLQVPVWSENDAWGIMRQKYDFSGGTGFYISNGKKMEITWTKGDYNRNEEYGNPLRLYDGDGNALKLMRGKTYICVLGQGNDITTE